VEISLDLILFFLAGIGFYLGADFFARYVEGKYKPRSMREYIVAIFFISILLAIILLLGLLLTD
jgi:hypothetical protein